jgi:hypothetical protein
MEKEEWKPFRNTSHKSDRKKFDEMWDTPKWYISDCSNSVQYVRLHPTLMSILLYDYKQLTECISEVERIENKVNSKNNGWTKKEERKKCLQLPYIDILLTTRSLKDNNIIIIIRIT